jgi:hypothetical protein
VVPGPPAQRLIVGETAFTFGIFESALDPMALPLHLTQSEEGCIDRGIGQSVLDRFRRSHLAPDNKMPASRLGFLAIPGPNPAMGDIDRQLTARAVAQDVTGPVLGTKPPGQALHGDGRRGSLLFSERASAAALRLGDMQPRGLCCMDPPANSNEMTAISTC